MPVSARTDSRRTIALRLASIVIALAIGLAVPVICRAQQSATPLASLSTPARLAIRATADSLTAEGLPGDALVAKAAEGLLKGADEARIVAAVHRLAADLRIAGAALGSVASPGEILAAASALRAGASPETVRQLRSLAAPGSASARRPLTVALVVLADLVARGAPARVAAESVTSLVARGASDDDLQALRIAVERDIDAGAEPTSAAVARSRAIADSLGAPSAARPPRVAPMPPRSTPP
jgi:hypothetical protein